MWIHSIQLHNFKSYDQARFSFPEPKNGRNIVLVGAENGHGKTTLLEAIYLCLYDKDAIHQLQRAGVKDKPSSYQEYLKSALFHDATPRWSQYCMELEVEIRQHYQGSVHGLKILRKWYFDESRQLKTEDNEIQAELFYDDSYHPFNEESLRHYLNTFALPFDYAPFFFFDGEKIVQMANQSGAGIWLGVAVKGLLGVTLLNRLQESLKSYRSKLISENASQQNQEALSKAEKALSLSQSMLNVLNEELANIEQQWQELNSKHEHLISALGGGTDIRTSADLMEQRQQLEKEINEFNDKVKAAIKAMPLAFLPRAVLHDVQQTLVQDLNRLNHEAGKNQIEHRVNEFWEKFVGSDKVRQALGSMAEIILSQPLMKEAMRDCWNDLFYPLPENCAGKITHNYLSVNAHAEIQNEIRQLQGLPQDKIGGLLAEIQQREDQQKRVLEELELLRGTGRDDLVEELKAVASEKDEVSKRLGHIKSNVLAKEKERDRAQNEVTRLQNEISDSNPKLLKSKRAQKIDLVIQELNTALLKQKVNEISQAATRINRSIAHDDRINEIRIEANGKMTLFGRDGKESKVDLSAGQMQILIMSLVSALAEVTQYHAPFVIDTPLARLDSEHREGLFRHWCNLKQQVILLSQDTEITPEVYRRLEPHIARTYLVKADSLASAGARSNITVDAYFE